METFAWVYFFSFFLLCGLIIVLRLLGSGLAATAAAIAVLSVPVFLAVWIPFYCWLHFGAPAGKIAIILEVSAPLCFWGVSKLSDSNADR